MTRILITTTPITGHVRPVLPVARELVARGHEVVWYTGRKFEAQIEAIGARFVPVTIKLDFDDSKIDALQSMDDRRPGLPGLKKVILDVFLTPIPAYARDIEPLLGHFDPGVVLLDHTFMATALLAEQRGLPRVVVAVGPLSVTSRDTAPFGLGIRPSATALGRLRNANLNWAMQHLIFRDLQRVATGIRGEMNLPAMKGFFLDWSVRIADRYILGTIPEFEYPRSDLPPDVEFVGPMLPHRVDDWTAPSWWPDVASARQAGRPVILVTQGTATTNPAHLILPAVRALACHDALVVATTDTVDPADVLAEAERPANLRLERFVPFTELLPMTDLIVTNGGYGGVQMALAYGVPLVVAGMSEDKMEVNQRVAWTGAGVSLNTHQPGPGKIDAAVRKVLADRSFRAAAHRLANAYARYDGPTKAADVVLAAADRS